jgi:hypothetical protein
MYSAFCEADQDIDKLSKLVDSRQQTIDLLDPLLGQSNKWNHMDIIVRNTHKPTTIVKPGSLSDYSVVK